MTDIITPLPFVLTNGTTADATQVMADLNQIRNDVNSAGLVPGGGSGNVVGPAVAVDGNLAVFDGTTGKIIKDGGPALAGSSYRGAVVRPTTGQIITVAGAAVIFGTVVSDTDSIFSVGQPTRLTVPAGVTKVRLSTQFWCATDTSTSYVQVSILKNGTTMSPIVSTVLSGPIEGANRLLGQTHSPIVTCTAADYFIVYIQPEDNANQDGPTWVWFEMEIIE
jgi:hypothetical protein